jgi:hypothetical protein
VTLSKEADVEFYRYRIPSLPRHPTEHYAKNIPSFANPLHKKVIKYALKSASQR